MRVDLLPAKTVAPTVVCVFMISNSCVRERPRLLQDRVGHTDLADVVQSAGEAQLFGPGAVLAQLQGDLGGQLADPRRVLAGIRVAVFGDCRQPLECLVVLLFEVLRARCDQLFQLGGAHSQQLRLVAGGKRVVRDLQRLDAQVGVAVEDLFVDVACTPHDAAMPLRNDRAT